MDTSALTKLVVAEAETRALRRWLRGRGRVAVSSDLARTELMRAVLRAAPDRAVQAQRLLDALTLVQITPAMFDSAGRLHPVGLRTLDAIHLAAALELGDDLEGLVTYDARLAEAAEANGVETVAP